MAYDVRAAILGSFFIANFAAIYVVATHPTKLAISPPLLVTGCLTYHIRGGGKGDWASWFEESDSGDPNEPYIQEYSDSEEEDDQLWLDSDESDNPRFDLAWSILRRKVLPIAREIEDRKLAKEEEDRTAAMEAAAAAAAATVAPVTPNVPVTFQPSDTCRLRVIISGPSPFLGSSDPLKAPELVTSPDAFPVFTATLQLPPGLPLEFRYGIIRFQDDAEDPDGESRALCQWEGLGRRLEVGPEAMCVWHSFKEDRQQFPRVTEQEYQLPAQEWTRWMRHHMKVTNQGFVPPA